MRTSTSGAPAFEQIERQAERRVAPWVWSWARDGLSVVLVALVLAGAEERSPTLLFAFMVGSVLLSTDRLRLGFAVAFAICFRFFPDDTFLVGGVAAAVMSLAMYLPFERMYVGMRPALMSAVMVFIAANVTVASDFAEQYNHILDHRNAARTLSRWQQPGAKLVEWSYVFAAKPAYTRLDAVARVSFATSRRHDVLCETYGIKPVCEGEFGLYRRGYVVKVGARGLLVAPGYAPLVVIDAFTGEEVERFDVKWSLKTESEVQSHKKWAEHFLCGPEGFGAGERRCPSAPHTGRDGSTQYSR